MITKLQQFLQDDDRGVSPVIGVILMVAITVILAAVIGAFVLDIGGTQEATPQASLSVENVGDSDGSITSVDVAHQGGDRFTAQNTQSLNVTVDGEELGYGDSSGGDVTGEFPFSAGETLEYEYEEDIPEDLEEGDTVTISVVWEGEETDSVIATRTYTIESSD